MELPDLPEDVCIPMEYVSDIPQGGMQIGGRSPVAPQYRGPNQKYFGTLHFDSAFSVSLFYSFDILGEDASRDIIDFNNRLLLPSQLIHAVVHPKDERGLGTVASSISAHGLQLGAPLLDRQWDPQAGGEPYPYSKLWGLPYVENRSLCGEVFEEAQRRGYRQMAQFDTPNPRSHPFLGAFPWDPGTLHVLFRVTKPSDLEFAFVVQQA